MEATAEEILLWKQIINERVLSGMTIKEWRIKNGIGKHKYNYWVHQIRQSQGFSKEEPFAEVMRSFQLLTFKYLIQLNLMIFKYSFKIYK